MAHILPVQYSLISDQFQAIKLRAHESFFLARHFRSKFAREIINCPTSSNVIISMATSLYGVCVRMASCLSIYIAEYVWLMSLIFPCEDTRQDDFVLRGYQRID